jgi:hypothetical protein
MSGPHGEFCLYRTWPILSAFFSTKLCVFTDQSFTCQDTQLDLTNASQSRERRLLSRHTFTSMSTMQPSTFFHHIGVMIAQFGGPVGGSMTNKSFFNHHRECSILGQWGRESVPAKSSHRWSLLLLLLKCLKMER